MEDVKIEPETETASSDPSPSVSQPTTSANGKKRKIEDDEEEKMDPNKCPNCATYISKLKAEIHTLRGELAYENSSWGRTTRDPKKVSTRHRRSFEMSIHLDITTLSKNSWSVVSASSSSKNYEVTRTGSHCCEMCSECKACSHQFNCTCPDYDEDVMCKHVHLVCRFLDYNVDDYEPSEDEDNSSEGGDDDV